METTIIYLSIGMAFWLLSGTSYLVTEYPDVDPTIAVLGKLILTISTIILWPVFLIMLIVFAIKTVRETRL